MILKKCLTVSAHPAQLECYQQRGLVPISIGHWRKSRVSSVQSTTGQHGKTGQTTFSPKERKTPSHDFTQDLFNAGQNHYTSVEPRDLKYSLSTATKKYKKKLDFFCVCRLKTYIIFKTKV
ncbi:hypothetical protein ILYODFUR_030180 [Ilyodon furcidens]|uniref:Uncharacterized protein n=1 Tax=Ilyodon furcidens TaxID=33524 RepID=A0ABV0SQD3_9TELE